MAGNDQAQAVEAETALSEEQVREYLKQHEDFLQRNPDMLDHLHIAHASGSAVSLVEKQVSVLRERNVDMRHRLKSLTANARENDSLTTVHLAESPEELEAVGQLKQNIVSAIGNLPPRERVIVQYYYYHQTGFDQLADQLGVTKGRVSQLHKQALGRLRKAVGGRLLLDDYF